MIEVDGRAPCTEDYPSAAVAAARWSDLAKEITEAALRRDDGGPSPSSAGPGSLLILGSGIASLGFTRDAEAELRAADRVFFCVADVPTAVWLRRLRPDAFDLYVLYEDSKPRYHTYVQMTEAILHYVRAGQRVVAVFYGHPGVFVLSTHRAMKIARQEGHRAVMRAGISALDCLCADLGVDPAQPGLQTYEATDMLIRGRRLDTSMHVVLWQVGLIGDMGYRRKGFHNRNLGVLVEYLQRAYGEDYEVTHYIAARYPTMEPTIAVHRLSELTDPRVHRTVTGISSLYLPPKDGIATDMEMAVRLGLARPGDTPLPPRPLREIDQHGPRESRAVREFAGFEVPEDYQYQHPTAACDFLIQLADDIELQRRYRTDPAGALSPESFPGLSDRERRLLLTRREGAAQLAAKGAVVSDAPNERLVRGALRRVHTARQLADAITRCGRERSRRPLLAFADGLGYRVRWPSLGTAIDDVLSDSLQPWSGVYLDEASRAVLTVVGSARANGASVVFLDGVRLRDVTFVDGRLRWDGPGGVGFASLTFGCADRVRRVTGTWRTGADGPARELDAAEPTAAGPALAGWTGRYLVRSGTGPAVPVEIGVGSDGRPVLGVAGERIAGALPADGALRWAGGSVRVQAPTGQSRRLTGTIDGLGPVQGDEDPGYIAPYAGVYHVRGGGRVATLTVTAAPGRVLVGGSCLDGEHEAVFHNRELTWDSGSVRLFVDPLTGAPSLYGTLAGEIRIQGITAGGAGGTGGDEPTVWHVGAGSLPAWSLPGWAVASLRAVAEPWRPHGGLQLYSEWLKVTATHQLLRGVAERLPHLRSVVHDS
ncbi:MULTISPECIES: SAM-dependent methyltransferase [Catenuloplanes]|uniref:Tetrapyrrole methylase domain-containing protein n=1 Tax=Catenuloplanes niger TaxID=587534 RepID=A0AAE3ZIX0_9ACTN|nr:SAM-dependent methyltransferase [Catenuloplanes niger]MDR7320779.1 hypothetical protein [Catenuloplanes niger]